METCPKCHREAPRIIRVKIASGRIEECPRCAYPPFREQGTWHETMPARDLDWYEKRGM